MKMRKITMSLAVALLAVAGVFALLGHRAESPPTNIVTVEKAKSPAVAIPVAGVKTQTEFTAQAASYERTESVARGRDPVELATMNYRSAAQPKFIPPDITLEPRDIWLVTPAIYEVPALTDFGHNRAREKV